MIIRIDMTSSLTTKAPQMRLKTSQRVILYCFFTSVGISVIESNTIASLYLKHYSNPKHKDINGHTCDVSFVGFIRKCDNQISLSVHDIGSASHNNSYFDRVIHKKDDDDDFDFPSNLPQGTSNPILCNIPIYKGGLEVTMTIYDQDDSPNDDDLVDVYKENITIIPSRSAQSATTYPYTLSGQGYSQTKIEIKVYCDDNFYGTNCLVHCVPCDNDDDGHYTCDASTGDKVCLPGYNGALCKIDINECESSPCQKGGICKDFLNHYTCECEGGTSGDRCEINVNECASEPCQHLSNCIDQINGYQCQCVYGYTGPTCDVDVDECASGPCENNATCADQVNGFSCECADGFEGKFCETEKDECQSNPCQNSGSCVDLINGFHCNCSLGYHGLLCETDDNCARNPCSDEATCSNVPNGYVCSCPPGLFGVQCKGSVMVIGLFVAAMILVLMIFPIVALRRRRWHNRGYNPIFNREHSNRYEHESIPLD